MLNLMEVKVIFRNKKKPKFFNAVTASKIRDHSISPREDLEGYKLTKEKKMTLLGHEYGKGEDKVGKLAD